VKFVIIILGRALTILFACTVTAQAIEINPEIEACIRKNAPESTSIESIRLTSKGRVYGMNVEEDKVLSAKIYWKYNHQEGTSNLLAVFDQPDDILGSRLLFLEKKSGNEIYLYMPALFKVRRITSDRISSSMYGMDFSYEDFQWMYNMLTTAATEQLPDTQINGEAMYVFAVIPQQSKGSMYEKILSYFDRKTCVIRKVEFYEQGNKLRKELTADPARIKAVEGKLIPEKFLMRDEKDNSETTMIVTSVSVDPPVADDLFDPALLKEHRDIH
jgi:hypothetical protein